MQSIVSCPNCHNDLCIQRVPILSTLDKKNVAQIVPIIHRREFKKGERLLTEGDETESIFIINEGSVKAFKYTPDGREQILYLFSEGDFFGEQNFLGNKTAPYHVEAMEAVKTCIFTKSQFDKVLNRYPVISLKIISELSRRISRMENAFQSMGIRNVDARIAGMLLEYEEKYGEYHLGEILIRLPLSREGMANYLGIARETMSRKLSQFESEGLIQTINNKTVKITNKNALLSLAGYVV
jgi:cAMP-binding proteins - catabolite gene activator and regulatory subunit of cAMP-dependent protein kinases